MCTSSLLPRNVMNEGASYTEPAGGDGTTAFACACGFDGGEVGGEGGVAEVEVSGGGDGVAETLGNIY